MVLFCFVFLRSGWVNITGKSRQEALRTNQDFEGRAHYPSAIAQCTMTESNLPWLLDLTSKTLVMGVHWPYSFSTDPLNRGGRRHTPSWRAGPLPLRRHFVQASGAQDSLRVWIVTASSLGPFAVCVEAVAQPRNDWSVHRPVFNLPSIFTV